MRVWTGVGIAVGLVVLVVAIVAAVVLAMLGDDEDSGTSLLDQLGTPEVAATIAERIRASEAEHVDSDRAPFDESRDAEQNDDPSLPGVYVPPQGRSHFPDIFEGHAMTPFCAAVPAAEGRDSETEVKTVGPVNRCYESNPPTSGTHLGVQRNVEIAPGIIIHIPPDPGVYPREVEIPRDAIPHVLEHAGVFVGHNCEAGDLDCESFVEELELWVQFTVDGGDRVVMARDTDLPVGEIGLAAWTRVLNVRWDAADFDEIEEFISVHSCRFDPEGFC